MKKNTKQLYISIADDDLRTLKTGKYQLCLAKKIDNEPYTVIWHCSNQYLSLNTFSWTHQYQLFGTNCFTPGKIVTSQTNSQDIAPGETCLLDEYGILNHAVTGGPPTGITINNELGPIHAGINQYSTGISGRSSFSPVFVTPRKISTGNTTFTPVDTILAWFEQNNMTGLMRNNLSSSSFSIEVTLKNISSAIIIYKDQKWSRSGNSFRSKR